MIQKGQIMMRESKIIKSQEKINFWIFSGWKRKRSKKVENDEKSKELLDFVQDKMEKCSKR
jgi:hypothetical protein